MAQEVVKKLEKGKDRLSTEDGGKKRLSECYRNETVVQVYTSEFTCYT